MSRLNLWVHVSSSACLSDHIMAKADQSGSESIRGSAVRFGNAGLIIQGKSGSGKSTLALQLIGLGAGLISDDGVIVTPREDALWLSAPSAIQGLIEARQFGLLRVEARPAWARAVVDLDQMEDQRLPTPKTRRIAGLCLPLFRKVESPAFATMLSLYMTGGLASDSEG